MLESFTTRILNHALKFQNFLGIIGTQLSTLPNEFIQRNALIVWAKKIRNYIYIAPGGDNLIMLESMYPLQV